MTVRAQSPAHFNDFVQALISHHPDVWFTVVTAEQEHLHGDAEQFLKFWRCSAHQGTREEQHKIGSHIYILNTTKLWLLYWLLVHLKFPPQRLSHYVFTYCQAVRHPVLLRGSLFLFSVIMQRSDRTNRRKETVRGTQLLVGSVDFPTESLYNANRSAQCTE